MGLIDQFEKRIDRAMNGAFAKTFRSSVEPIELVSKLRTEADNKAAIRGAGHTLIPNAYTITLSPSDYDRFASWEQELLRDLANCLYSHAKAQGYSLVGQIRVQLQRTTHLDKGVFHIISSHQEGKVAPVASGAAQTGTPTLTIDGKTYPIADGVTILGRGGDADIAIEDTGMSRHHAKITKQGSTYILQDLGSTNGTFVDGDRITSVELVDGAAITLGRTQATFGAHHTKPSR